MTNSSDSDPPRRALIVGCGYVGSVLGLELAWAGFEVSGARRDPSGLPAPIRPVAVDVTDPESCDALPADVDLLVYAVAAGRGADETQYRAVYVDGPRHVVASLARRCARPRIAVFVSSTSVYGVTDGSVVDEDTPAEPDSFRGRAVLDGEAAFGDAPWRTVAMRFGGIYGPGRDGMLDAVAEGRIGLSTDGVSPHTNRIHRDDAARAIAHVAALPDPAPVYCGVDRESAPRDVVVTWIADRVLPSGRSPERIDAGPRARGGDKRVSSARLVASGFAFRYPTWREGYAALLEERS